MMRGMLSNFHCHYFQVHFDPHQCGIIFKVSSMGQIEIFTHFLLLKLCANKWIMLNNITTVDLQYLKPFNCVPINELLLI